MTSRLKALVSKATLMKYPSRDGHLRSWSSSYAIRLRPHRSGRADFPHPALPESNPRHIRACAQVRVMCGTGSVKRAVRISNSNQLIRRLF